MDGAYLDEVVETQGKLFDSFSQNWPGMNTEDFIDAYMKSRTRKSIDESQAYVCTMDPDDLCTYFLETDAYVPKPGRTLEGFSPDWIGEFYAYYQWRFGMPSSEIVQRVPVDFLVKAYGGLHDLDLALAVEKVGA